MGGMTILQSFDQLRQVGKISLGTAGFVGLGFGDGGVVQRVMHALAGAVSDLSPGAHASPGKRVL